MGETHLKLKLGVPNTALAIDGIAFNQTDEQWPVGVTQALVAFKLAVNDFRGIRSPQMVVEHIEPIS